MQTPFVCGALSSDQQRRMTRRPLDAYIANFARLIEASQANSANGTPCFSLMETFGVVGLTRPMSWGRVAMTFQAVYESAASGGGLGPLFLFFCVWPSD